MDKIDKAIRLAHEIQDTGRPPTPEEIDFIGEVVGEIIEAFQPIMQALAEMAEQIVEAFMTAYMTLPSETRRALEMQAGVELRTFPNSKRGYINQPRMGVNHLASQSIVNHPIDTTPIHEAWLAAQLKRGTDLYNG